VERRSYSLPEIVPLCRGLLATLRNIPEMLCSSTARAIFRDMHIRLLARLMTNNLSESLAAYSLTLPGRDEIRKREKGGSTRGPETPPQGRFSVRPDTAILKAHCHEEILDDEVITAVFQFAVHSESMIGEDECASSAFVSHLGPSESYTPGENEYQEVWRIQTSRQHLASFAIISEEQRLSFDPYQALHEHAERPISELAVKVGMNPGKIGQIFTVWPFAPTQDLPFLQNPASLPSADLRWPAAYPDQEWAELAERALRLISCATSESHAERVLSMEKNFAGLHGTPFSLPRMEARF
jgi:hypothetical protein